MNKNKNVVRRAVRMVESIMSVRSKTRYLYYFQGVQGGRVLKHIQLYQRWIEPTREQGIDIKLLCFIPLPIYLNKYETIRRKKQDYITVIPTPYPGRLNSAVILLYFLSQSLLYSRVVVHVRKTSTKHLDIVKKLVGDKLKYILDIEGDIVAETEFLKKHPYKPGFYGNRCRQRWRDKQHDRLSGADHIITSTTLLRDTLHQRFKSLAITHKTTVLPIATPADFDFCIDRRDRLRKQFGIKDKFVMIYTGSVHYSWQNISRSLEIFKLAQDELQADVFLILLIPEQDHDIANEFIEKIGLSSEDYLLAHVGHDEINHYLNASDIGIVLRHNHLMNKVAYPAKFVEYIAAGLPVLMTSAIPLADEINERAFGVVIDDMDGDANIIQNMKWIINNQPDRNELSDWAHNRLSAQANIDKYINLLDKFSTND